MPSDLAHRRRVLARAMQAYVAADLAWRAAALSARTWFPDRARPDTPPIGDPGSRIRRLFEARDRALLRLFAAREKYEVARRRAAPARWRVRLLIRS